jgi:hypothetical protein
MKLSWDISNKRWNVAATGQPCVHLQGIGEVPAKPMRDFAPSDWMGWNFGYASQIERIVPTKGGKMADVFMVGFPKPRRMGLHRLVAVASAKWRQSSPC